MKKLFLFSFDFKNFRINLLWFSFILLLNNPVLGQVRTTVLNGHDIKEFIPNHSSKRVLRSIIMPPVNIEATLEAKKRAGRTLPTFGVLIPNALSVKNGEVEYNDDLIIWKIAIHSPSAISLNLQIDNLILPENSEMYVYNDKETMVSGPITNKHVYKGIYATDIIEGDKIIVEVIMPKEQLDAFRLNINNVIHGFKENKLDLRAYGASGACNVDVNCPAGNGLELQRDAVAKIYSGSAEHCTGSLINNACEDLRPFFLTANHCLDGMEANWVFRFNYDSPNPVTPACRGSEPTTWITYNGAAVRASNAASDFALLELNQSVIGQPTLAWAGWNRNDITPTGGFLIHHPKGDVKKISTIGGTPVISENGGIAGSGDTHIRTSWALGTAEPASSGAPLFDNNADIIGQIHSGNNIGCTNPSAEITWSGRFFISWTGGATNTTRLSNWLSNGMNNPPTTINAIRSPTITGTSPVCISNSAFTLNNIIPGRTATWTVTPANLFATSSGAATSGAGTLATLRAASSSVSGLATLTFTISAAAGCNTTTLVSIQIWVGVPGQPTTNPSGRVSKVSRKVLSFFDKL